MSITLGSIVLPDGFRWQDEHAWSPVAQTTAYSLGGALLIEEAAKLAGRPITLIGGINFAWMTKGNLEDLIAALESATDTGLTLTLHDSRTFQVLARHGTDGAVTAAPVPRILDSGFADVGENDWYYVDAIRLIAI